MTTTHKPKPQEGVPVLSDRVVIVGYAPEFGISDITARVDASQTPAVIKATLFSEALCRLEQMKGEREQLDRNILAQEDRVAECHRESMEAERSEIKRVMGDSLMDVTMAEWQRLSPEEKDKLLGKLPKSTDEAVKQATNGETK